LLSGNLAQAKQLHDEAVSISCHLTGYTMANGFASPGLDS
jgi:hypothetical protein